jgi:hypothetical protein
MKKKRTNQIEVNDVWERVKASFWMYFFTAIFFGVIFIVAYIILIIPWWCSRPSRHG